MREFTSPHELRSSLRTHLFVGAVLKTPGGDCTARIRNISRTGALVEAAILPDVGTPVSLVRGSLKATGQTVWRSAGRCGIAFSSDVIVEAWLPDSNSRQARVDALVRDVRSDRFASDEPLTGAHNNKATREPTEVLAELASVLGSKFASDPLIVASFCTELQGLDLLTQVLEALNEPGSTPRVIETVSACGEILARLKSAAVADEVDLVRNGSDSGSPRKHSLTIPIDHVSARF